MKAHLRIGQTPEDRAAVYRLRYELYVEDQRLFADEADHQRRWLTDEYDEGSSIVLAEVDGEVVGTARMTFGSDTTFTDESRQDYAFARFRHVLDESDLAVITRLLVHPKYRGSGLSLELFAKSFELAAQRGAELILGSCELHLINHYWKLGFRPWGELSNHPTNGVLVRIAVVTGDLEHLRRIDSPMLDALAQRTRPTDNVAGILPLVTENPSVISQAWSDEDHYWHEVTHRLRHDGGPLPGVLGELSREEAAVLLAGSHVLACGPGDALIRKGHVSRTLYILLSGSLDIEEDGALVAQVQEPGALVGEVALMASVRRMSDVVTGAQGGRVLALSDRTLRQLMASHSVVAAKLLHYMTRELCHKLLERAGERAPGAETL